MIGNELAAPMFATIGAPLLLAVTFSYRWLRDRTANPEMNRHYNTPLSITYWIMTVVALVFWFWMAKYE